MLGVKDFHILASKNGEEVLELLFITTSSLTPQEGNYGWSWLESLFMIKNLSVLFWVGKPTCFCYMGRRFSHLSSDACFPLDPKNAQFSFRTENFAEISPQTGWASMGLE